MDFELSKEQKQIQKAVREFVKGEFKKEVIQELVENHQYPEKIWKKAAELGFIGIHFPEEYSGMGLGCLENILVAEELARGDSTVGTCLLIADFASEIILHNGSEAQKAKWLPKVAEGECLSCGAFTEPDHGSDITTVATTAVKDGDSWVINGSKMFITNSGPLAGFYCV
ncbi:MAG: acyl-CoA dehydrogenase family protein, partial [Desulfobacteraceae bacterium]